MGDASVTDASEINWPTPQEWAAELRTTKKGQVIEHLRNVRNTANCCLGILAEMAGAECVGSFGFEINGRGVWADMALGPRPEWMTAEIGARAAWLNDEAVKTFAEIADWIDAGMEVPS